MSFKVKRMLYNNACVVKLRNVRLKIINSSKVSESKSELIHFHFTRLLTDEKSIEKAKSENLRKVVKNVMYTVLPVSKLAFVNLYSMMNAIIENDEELKELLRRGDDEEDDKV